MTTALFWLAGLGAFLVICWLIGRLEERREEWHLSPWRYECFQCRGGYNDPRAFTWHMQANHVDTHISDCAPNATHRRDDAGRDSAGEILGGEGRAVLGDARLAGPMEQRTRDHLFSTEET